jgi:hypothetical protein
VADALYLSMCSGCNAQYAVQGEPAGCEMPGDNGFLCPACTARLLAPVAVVPLVKSYRLRDGWPGSRWVVLGPPVNGSCLIRRLGFPADPPLRMPATELCAGMP